jgi:hypothetical protein
MWKLHTSSYLSLHLVTIVSIECTDSLFPHLFFSLGQVPCHHAPFHLPISFHTILYVLCLALLQSVIMVCGLCNPNRIVGS